MLVECTSLTEGRTYDQRNQPLSAWPPVSPGYFGGTWHPHARRARIQRSGHGNVGGRDGGLIGAGEAVLSRRNALGRHVNVDGVRRWLTIVGVAEDVHQGGAWRGRRGRPSTSGSRRHSSGSWLSHMTYFVRTSGDLHGLSSAIRGELRTIDPNQPIQTRQSIANR